MRAAGWWRLREEKCRVNRTGWTVGRRTVVMYERDRILVPERRHHHSAVGYRDEAGEMQSSQCCSKRYGVILFLLSVSRVFVMLKEHGLLLETS